MNLIKVFAVFAFAVSSLAQTPAIHSGSAVYIEPMGGYETYLAAAILKKHVPLVVVIDEDKANYVLRGKIAHANMNSAAPAMVVNNTVNIGTQTQSPGNQVSQAMQQGYEEGAARRRALGMTLMSIAVIDPESSQIMFSYSAEKDGKSQLQKTAEDCAKHLGEFIEKSEKPKK